MRVIANRLPIMMTMKVEQILLPFAIGHNAPSHRAVAWDAVADTDSVVGCNTKVHVALAAD